MSKLTTYICMKPLPWAVLLGCSGVVCTYAEPEFSGLVSPLVIAPAIPSPTPSAELPFETRPETHKTLTLPRVVVEDSRLPSFSNREILTKTGLALLLSKNYPGASLPGQDPTNSILPNYASLMYDDDLRLAQMSQLERISAVTAIEGDTAEAKKLKEEMQRTFIRGHNWRTEGMDKSVNRWRR